MTTLNLTYGFLSTYSQTIFVRQVFNRTQWELQYSPIIYHSTRSLVIPPNAALPPNASNIVSLRQGMFYLAHQVSTTGFTSVNTEPMAQWLSI